MKQFLAVLFTLLLLQSCSQNPQTKEEYLNEYSQFIEQIEENATSFDQNDWEKQEEVYKLFADEYYDQFSGDLTIAEKLQAKGYGVAYNSMKQKDNWEAIGEFIEDLSSKGEKAVEKFLDDAGDDTEKVEDLIERVGKLVGDEIEKISGEVEIELDGSEEVLERLAKKAENALEEFVEDIEDDVKELEKKLKKE
ncbi:MAG: DUF6565 domain-containing protein [Chitinophagales bacterium]